MKDVIFTGAKSSMNIAEVTLNFENTDRKLDLAYDKIAISRRIYRSGENEYKINNKRVRLKDVRELFFDTGIGKEGYSIIGQGRIDEIIMSTPKDRRAIFEEASGISKHKYRRDEASKKLESVNNDLEIIEKELEYKEKDYGLLKSYKENYLSHRDLTDEINKKSFFYLKNKSYDLIKKRDKIKSHLNDTDESLRILKSKEEEIKNKLGPFKKEYDHDNRTLENLLTNLSSYERNIDKARSSLKLNEQKLDYDKKDMARIEEVLNNLSSNYEKESESLKDNRTKLESLLSETGKFEEELQAKKNFKKDLEDEISKLKEDVSSEGKILEDINTKVLDYQVLEQSRAIIDEKRKKDLKEKSLKLKNLDSEIRRLKEIYDELKEATNKKEDEISHIEEKIRNLADHVKARTNELSQKTNSLNNLKLDIKSLISDYKIEKNLLENNQGYFYSVQDFLKKTRVNGLAGYYLDTLANLISVRAGYEEIIDNLVGAGLQNIVTRTKDDTRELINFVNREKLGRLTFLPIDSVRSFMKKKPRQKEVIAMAYELVGYDDRLSGIIGHFLGSTVVVKDIDNAISLSKKIKGYRIISLNLDIINTWGSMVAGNSKNKRSNTNLLNRKKKLNDLEKSIKSLNLKRKNLEDKTCQIDRNLGQFKKELISLREIYEEKTKEKSSLKTDLERVNLRLESLGESRNELIASGTVYEDEAIDVDIKALKKEQEKLTLNLEAKKEKLDQKFGNFTKLRDEILALTNKVEIARRDKSLLENTTINLENSLADIENNQKIQEKLKNKLEADLEGSNMKGLNLRKSIDLYEKESTLLEKDIRNLKETISNREGENKKLLEENQSLEEKLKELDLKRVKLSYKLEAAEEAYKNLEDEISPYITMNFDDLREIYKDEKSLNPSKTDLINIQKKINKIGFFTETALEDFDRVDKEVSFIKDQITDLKNSKKDIEKMIIRLEKEMREEFSKNFDLINKNFTKIFKILFMGGDARLILDSDDFLTAGVEIEAKPPSKSPKSITLLSGGEKALTAVALLFAIFEQNPAPFSILDEIDAALDESNIKRYIDYLKSLSDKTQFIMITHRQTTMQLAEKIHGVTIDDEGVSKLYSIGFTDD